MDFSWTDEQLTFKDRVMDFARRGVTASQARRDPVKLRRQKALIINHFSFAARSRVDHRVPEGAVGVHG